MIIRQIPDLHVVRGGKVDELPPDNQTKVLAIGSDVEIARRVVDDLSGSFGRIVHAESARTAARRAWL